MGEDQVVDKYFSTNLMMDVVATSIARRMESGNCLN